MSLITNMSTNSIKNVLRTAGFTLVLLISQFSWANTSAALDLLINAINSNKVAITRPTLGIELEGVYPGQTRIAAIEDILQLVTNEVAPVMYPEHDFSYEHFTFETRRGEPRYGTKLIFTSKNAPEQKPIVWQVKDDGSIQAPEGFVGIEIVTPILYTSNDVDKFDTLLKALRSHSFRAEPHSAALQVHTGVTTNGPLPKTSLDAKTQAEALLFIWVFSKIEDEILKKFKITESRKKFAQPTPTTIVDLIESGDASILTDNFFELINTHYNYRYWALNPHSLFQFGTFEIRFANSTTDSNTVNALTDFGLKLTLAIKSLNSKLIELLRKYPDAKQKIPLSEFATALDLDLNKQTQSLFNQTSCADILAP